MQYGERQRLRQLVRLVEQLARSGGVAEHHFAGAELGEHERDRSNVAALSEQGEAFREGVARFDVVTLCERAQATGGQRSSAKERVCVRRGRQRAGDLLTCLRELP